MFENNISCPLETTFSELRSQLGFPEYVFQAYGLDPLIDTKSKKEKRGYQQTA